MEKSRKDSRASSRSLVSASPFFLRITAELWQSAFVSVYSLFVASCCRAATLRRMLTQCSESKQGFCSVEKLTSSRCRSSSDLYPVNVLLFLAAPSFLPRRWILICAAIIFVCRRLLLIQAEIRLRHIRRREARRLRMQKFHVSEKEEVEESGHAAIRHDMVAAYLTVRVVNSFQSALLTCCCAVNHDDGCRNGSQRCKP